MSRPDDAVALFQNGYACSQAILLAYASECGLSAAGAARLGAGFGGGMHLGSACGAATAAVMVLGLTLCGDECTSVEGRIDITCAVEKFGERFGESVGSLDCPEILDCDVRTPAGAAKAKEHRLYDTVCPDAVRAAAAILEAMLPSTAHQK